MFKNKKYPLKLFAIISLAFVVLTTIFVSIFGVNTSVEIGGGSQIEITLSYKDGETYVSGRENTQEYVEAVKEVLAEHNCYIDNYVVEDKLVDTYLVVRIAKNKIEDANKIPAQIASKLGIAQTRVSSVQTLSSYFADNQMLFIGLAVLAIIVVCFFAGWLRYTLVGGVTLAFGALHNIILSLAVIFLYRVQFSIVSLVGILVGTVLSVLVTALILERVRENAKSKQYAALSVDENLLIATKQNKNLLWFAIVLFAITVVMICVPIRYIQLSGVSLMLCIIAGAYNSIFVSPALHAYLVDVRNTKAKQKLSKNVTTSKK